MNNGQLPNAIEAMLFAAAEPLPVKAIGRVLEGTKIEEIKNALAALNERYTQIGGALRIREIAGGYQLCALPEYSGYIEALLVRTKTQKLSTAALEALAVIAYRQPVSTPEIEKIRGVESSGVLRTLLERNLISIIGRSDRPGRPLLYGTTKEFLYYFGLNHLRELPRVEELEMMLKRREPISQLSVHLEPTTGKKGEQTPAPAEAGTAAQVTAKEEDSHEIAEVGSQQLVLKRPSEGKTEHTEPEKTHDKKTGEAQTPPEEIVEVPAPAEEEDRDLEIIRTASEVLTTPVE